MYCFTKLLSSALVCVCVCCVTLYRSQSKKLEVSLYKLFLDWKEKVVRNMEEPGRYLNRFYYYLGIVRSIDQEMAATGKIIYYTYRSQEREYRSHHWGAIEVSESSQREEGKVHKHLCCGSSWKEQCKQAWDWPVCIWKALPWARSQRREVRREAGRRSRQGDWVILSGCPEQGLSSVSLQGRCKSILRLQKLETW